MTSDAMEELDPRQRRLQLLAGLQERIGLIQLNISRLDSQIVATMDEKQRHEEDLQFYFQLVLELGGFNFTPIQRKMKQSFRLVAQRSKIICVQHPKQLQ
jgi:hypothetical protein